MNILGGKAYFLSLIFKGRATSMQIMQILDAHHKSEDSGSQQIVQLVSIMLSIKPHTYL